MLYGKLLLEFGRLTWSPAERRALTSYMALYVRLALVTFRTKRPNDALAPFKRKIF